jgi:hypothetical protein
LGIVKTGVLRGTDFGVNEQYPEIINRRRQALVPKMHEERRKDNRRKLFTPTNIFPLIPIADIFISNPFFHNILNAF